MSYIESIRKNVRDAIQVREMALTKRLNYKIAKIMYHNGRNDIDEITARGILKELKEKEIPLDLMDDLDLLLRYQERGKLDDYAIYRGISKYANRKYISELSDYIWADYHYGKAIHEYMKKGIPINKAIKIFEKKVTYEMKKEGLSEFATLAKLLYFKTNFEALEFEKAYSDGKAITLQPILTIRQRLFSSGEYHHRKVNGIMLISKTENGLENLAYLVGLAFRTGDQQFLSQLSSQGKNNDLFITDFTFNDNKDNTEVSYYSRYYKHICLLPEKSTEEALSAFFHESTHFLDNVTKTEDIDSYYSVGNPVVQEVLERIKAKRMLVLRGVSTAQFPNINAHQYTGNPELRQKWLEEIQTENPEASPEDIRLLFQQKIMYERKKYKILIGCLEDIYDGLTIGKVQKYGGRGHGAEYYSDSTRIAKEFIAEIGAFYNNGGIDVLYHELGADLTQRIVAMYQSFIGLNPNEIGQTLSQEETKNTIVR